MGQDLYRTLSELDRARPVEGLERGRLRPIEVAAQSIAAAAPTAGLVTTPSLVHATGAPAATAMVVATLLILLVASSINQFTRRLVAPGSLYTFVIKGLGPLAGLIAAGALSTGYLFVSLSSLVGASSYLSRGLGLVLPAWRGLQIAAEPILAAGLALGIGALLLIGVRRTTVVMLVIEVIAIGTVVAALVIATVVGLNALPGIGRTATRVWETDAGPGALGAGVVIALTAFVGFESSSALGAEAQRPMRTLPRVITGTAIGVGALLAVGTLIQATAFNALGLEASANPVDDILQALQMGAALPFIDLAIVASFLACATASMMALVRLIMALALDGVLPAWLGVPHPRWRTPHGAALVLLPVLVLVPTVLLAAGVPVRVAMDQLIGISVAGYLTAYLLVSAAVLRFLPRIGERTLRPMLVAAAATACLVPALGAYLGYGVLSGHPAPATALGLVVAAALIWWGRARRRTPELLDRLGSYDQPSSSSIWWGPPPERPAGEGRTSPP